MNLLVRLMRDHPEMVDALSATEAVRFDRLIGALSVFEDFPLALDEMVARETLAHEPVGPLLEGSYLPVVEGETWRARTQPGTATEPVRANEWVTFAGGQMSPRGVVLPDDNSREWRVSLFARVDDAVRRASIDYGIVETSGAASVGASVSESRECSLPDRGKCNTGECSGDCELKRVYDDRDGLVCWCPREEASTKNETEPPDTRGRLNGSRRSPRYLVRWSGALASWCPFSWVSHGFDPS
jgi:hypothetical protein